jgi:hypothetical protein
VKGIEEVVGVRHEETEEASPGRAIAVGLDCSLSNFFVQKFVMSLLDGTYEIGLGFPNDLQE